MIISVPPKPACIRQASSLCELFQNTVAAAPHRVALRTPDDSVRITWRQYGERVRAIAAGLAALGVERGDTVGLMLTNRPEFHLIDTAAYHLGAAPFSVYNTSSPEQIAYILGNAGNTVFVCEKQFLPQVRKACEGSAVRHILCVEQVEELMSLADLERAGDPAFDFEKAWRAVEPTDTLTVIYTSGTTGPPKGVELAHASVLHFIAAVQDIGEFAAGTSGRAVSYLPDAHALNRWLGHYGPAVTGASVTTLADLKQLIVVLPQVRPTIFVAVPMLWYKIQAAIEEGVAAEHGLRKVIARWALDVGVRTARCRVARKPVPALLNLEYEVAHRLVLSGLARRVGLDQVTVALTGAAPIAAETLEFILGLGIRAVEGWGMSEILIVTANPPDDIRPGTVGKPLPGVEITVAADGELLVRTPTVMKGYRNDPGKTAELIDADGWVHTGDVGSIDADGYIRIVDRKKELIINSAGKNISPANIENAVKLVCPLVGSAVAIGDRRKYITALIALDADAAAAYAKTNGLPGPDEVLTDPGARTVVAAAIERANRTLARVEQIREFRILPVFWEPGSDELTPTMKLKRKPIAEKYAAEIEALYAGGARS
ncbi:AMP-binding protein [Nocardia uniformis]|uniref:Acyl-CoA synthetase n=1 Tax=Nocardia uniformis TaxID=53432 RepID=A0A849BWF9_9NOCA|nr:AMP-binding protein [Nocardia uniformis]NNH70933.1 AMP-binding protein [Nocardia uniformis]